MSLSLKYVTLHLAVLAVCAVLLLDSNPANAQQFNTDNYITMPHGTGTFIPTYGQRNANSILVFALAPRFELTLQASLFWENKDTGMPSYFTTNVFGKYMFWVNDNNNGGGGVFLGIGKSPSYFSEAGYSPMHKNYWTAVPISFPLFNSTLSWDIMPGAMVDFDYGNNKETAWGFTYSSRLAIYKIIPKTAIVGEIYGTAGRVYSKPEFKAGLRWEGIDWVIIAATYGRALDGSKAAGFEIGAMIFTPRFLTRDFIKNNRVQYPVTKNNKIIQQ